MSGTRISMAPDRNTELFQYHPNTKIETAWDITIPEYPDVTDAQERLDAFSALVRKHGLRFDLGDLIINEPIDMWEAKLQEAKADIGMGLYLIKNAQHVSLRLRDEIRESKRDTGRFAHIIEHLPIADTLEQFTTAAEALGDTVLDLNRAVDFDAQSTVELRAAGTRLLSLITLLSPLRLQYQHPGATTAALFARVVDLPVLEQYERGNTLHPMYEDSDMEPHTRLLESIKHAKEIPATFLTLLALDKIPNLTLDIATSVYDVEERLATIDNIGQATTVDAPKLKRRRMSGTTGPLGTYFREHN